jgi:hypothetical protein
MLVLVRRVVRLASAEVHVEIRLGVLLTGAKEVEFTR